MVADLYPPEIWKYKLLLVVVQLLSWVWFFATPWAAAHQAFLSFTVSQSLFKVMSIESVMPSDHLIFCCPLLLLPSIFPSTGVFSNESVLPIRWPKYWSFSFSISPSKEIATISSKKKGYRDVEGKACRKRLRGSMPFPSSSTRSLSEPGTLGIFMVASSHQHGQSLTPFTGEWGEGAGSEAANSKLPRRKWKPTPVFLPGESQGRGSLVGCHLWGRTESDTTEAT